METIISLTTRQLYDIVADKHGENQQPCPECSHNRRKKNIKCFSYNVEKELGYCNHCEASFVKHQPHEEKQYIKPTIEFKNFTKVSDSVVKYFEGRGISQRTLLQMKIGEKSEWMPQIEKESNCIMFPYFKDGELINVKYRDGKKNFKLSSGAELIWYNYDAIQKCIDDSAELVIVEGECFPAGTEILTEKGWINLENYTAGKVAQFENGNINFENPICRIEKEYHDYLIEIKSKGYYSLTTKNHNLLLKNKKGYTKRTAEFLSTSKGVFDIPRVGILDAKGINLSDDQIRLMLATCADFTFRKSGDIYGCFLKQRKVDRITEILDRLNIRYAKNLMKNGYTAIFIHRGHGLDYCSKIFNHELISKLSTEQCKLIIEEMVLWDGNYVKGRKQYEFSSKHYSNISFIQTISHLSGYVSTVMKRKNKFGEWYKCSVLLNKSKSNTQALKFEKIPHIGKVYCVQMPAGNLLVRQNGIITVTGNCDALAVIQSGIDYVISVPNGASIGKMDYFDSSFELINKVKTFIIATDNDLKGVELKNDLVRRLGFEKCKIANLRAFKDLNEVLVSEGVESVKNTILNAKLLRLSDIYEVSDFESELDAYFEHGLPQGKKIDIPELDDKIRWLTGHYATVSGSPTSGKSEFVDFICAKLNIIHGWKVGYYSPESAPLPVHFSKVFSKFSGFKFGKQYNNSESDRYTVQDYVKDNYYWVAPVDDINLDEILKRFEYLVKAKGVKVFVIDPFNRIETDQDYNHDKLLYIKKTLKKIISFCKKNDALLFLIAHPTKLQKMKDGKYPMATMYDISGSADFFNMTSYGISVRREQDDNTMEFLSHGQVAISKAKLNETMGKTGVWEFRYNINNGRYVSDIMDDRATVYDNSNWITKEEYKEPEKEYKIPTVTPNEAFGDSFPELQF
ncbi:toprim domain-containing protein [Chryseobacterium sp.]|uniref:toprim domain-containing protein n=1 Tax=Chryseobacterium sp. TaxID=1871047 RepID=UPI0032192A55